MSNSTYWFYLFVIIMIVLIVYWIWLVFYNKGATETIEETIEYEYVDDDEEILDKKINTKEMETVQVPMLEDLSKKMD